MLQANDYSLGASIRIIIIIIISFIDCFAYVVVPIPISLGALLLVASSC
jgi:hypothetical protein